MKFNKKIALISVATLIGVSPVMPTMMHNENIVHAATYKTRTLGFKHNSYVYNKRGKRIKYRGKSYFKKNAKLKAAIVTSGKKTNYFTYVYSKNSTQKLYLKVYTIKGKKYFNIGRGSYININNIGLVDNVTIYTDLNVRVKLTKNIRTVDGNGNKNNEVLKKGTVVTADGLGQIPGGEWIDSGVAQLYYRLVGKKNTYISSEHTKLLSPVQNGNTFENLFKPKADLKDGKVIFYTIDGTSMFPGYTSGKHGTFELGNAMYLWVPKDNKAELFYNIVLPKYSQKLELLDKDGKETSAEVKGDLFIKADDLSIYKDSEQKPINTAEQAEAGKSVATTSQKAALTELLNDENSVKAGFKYINAAKGLRDSYDQAIAQAKELLVKNEATGNQVTFAIGQINRTSKALNGRKIKVAYPNYLTKYDRNKILQAAIKATGNNDIQWANHNRELWEMTESKDSDVSYKKLNIADYIEADTPKIKNKKGYSSSATDAEIKKNSVLAKYAKMLDYNMRKSSLVAKKTMPIYQNVGKVGTGANFNVNKLNLKKTKKSIKKGNNIGYYATLVVEAKGQYYFMIQEKDTYFVKANDVTLDNFSQTAEYKKYQKMITDLMGPNQLVDFGISVKSKRDTAVYKTNDYFEIMNSKHYALKKGKYTYFVDPYVVKYNGEYYFTGGREFNSDYDPEGAVLCKDVAKVVKGQIVLKIII